MADRTPKGGARAKPEGGFPTLLLRPGPCCITIQPNANQACGAAPAPINSGARSPERARRLLCVSSSDLHHRWSPPPPSLEAINTWAAAGRLSVIIVGYHASSATDDAGGLLRASCIQNGLRLGPISKSNPPQPGPALFQERRETLTRAIENNQKKIRSTDGGTGRLLLPAAVAEGVVQQRRLAEMMA